MSILHGIHSDPTLDFSSPEEAILQLHLLNLLRRQDAFHVFGPLVFGPRQQLDTHFGSELLQKPLSNCLEIGIFMHFGSIWKVFE